MVATRAAPGTQGKGRPRTAAMRAAAELDLAARWPDRNVSLENSRRDVPKWTEPAVDERGRPPGEGGGLGEPRWPRQNQEERGE